MRSRAALATLRRNAMTPEQAALLARPCRRRTARHAADRWMAMSRRRNCEWRPRARKAVSPLIGESERNPCSTSGAGNHAGSTQPGHDGPVHIPYTGAAEQRNIGDRATGIEGDHRLYADLTEAVHVGGCGKTGSARPGVQHHSLRTVPGRIRRLGQGWGRHQEQQWNQRDFQCGIPACRERA